MIQEIIALTIVFAAVAYTVYSVLRNVTKKNNKTGCDSGSCACSANKKMIKK